MNPPVPPPALPAQPPLLSYHGPMGDNAAVWRDGNLLVVTNNSHLPPRCLKCNAPSESYLRLRPTWHHPLIYLLILVSLIVYVIVAVCVQKRGTLHVGLCHKHRTQRLVSMLVGWGLATLSLVVLCVAISLESGGLGILFGVLLLAGILTGFIGSRVISVDHIDHRCVYLKNVNAEYLQQLPAVVLVPAMVPQQGVPQPIQQ